MLSRRGLIGSLISLAAAPAIVRASSLMPVKVMEPVLVPTRVFYFQNRVFWTGPQTISFNASLDEYRLCRLQNWVRTAYGR